MNIAIVFNVNGFGLAEGRSLFRIVELQSRQIDIDGYDIQNIDSGFCEVTFILQGSVLFLGTAQKIYPQGSKTDGELLPYHGEPPDPVADAQFSAGPSDEGTFCRKLTSNERISSAFALKTDGDGNKITIFHDIRSCKDLPLLQAFAFAGSKLFTTQRLATRVPYLVCTIGEVKVRLRGRFRHRFSGRFCHRFRRRFSSILHQESWENLGCCRFIKNRAESKNRLRSRFIDSCRFMRIVDSGVKNRHQNRHQNRLVNRLLKRTLTSPNATVGRFEINRG
ncbi:Multidrug resistance-associated ABC transporter protein [Mycena sanguinolenta]|uniref:Multidrug resistance-associated ABC transporter protein n=1 Tax=Mycena sanguinolenta TaxID=230812 RepID=A0A8H7DHR9_9AGAR|nr:Multidrug resistance-associated ABC transporter protein [Mycena sanguinolenta]